MSIDLTGATARAEIDLDAIRDNVAELDRRSGAAAVMAVVKADAYGHGLVPSAQAALAGGASYLGVAQLAEALTAREAGITAPLLTWLFPPGADLVTPLRADIELSAGAPWSLREIAAAAREHGRAAVVHLKVDTGLGRGGSWGEDWAEMVRLAAQYQAEGAITVQGIWSHFVWADAPTHPTVRHQQEVFVEACEQAERQGVRPVLRHLANSAATLTNPSAHFDMVRPGIAVYGLSPVPDLGTPADYGLREAMRLTARLVGVKDAPAGQGVSYGHQYTTSGPTRLGLIPLGYSDGIPRDATNVGPLQIGDLRTHIAGRVCMDQVVADLGPDSPAAVGDEVVLWGRGADGEPTAQDWAAATDTISYELVTRLGARVPRVYLRSETSSGTA
ncbi:alanine racemase [Janibacter sp. GXQ6167]|uniref:alanine racemase n=1 Tax=Janibacter sp. GXQ6167 TaxID=3240791 RepID=UPI003524918C